MKKILLSILFIGFSLSLLAQNKDIEESTILFVKESYFIKESNSIHKNESNEIINLFHYSLMKSFISNESKSKSDSLVSVFKNLDNNSKSSYEDSSDIRRMKLRRATCFASMAMLSNEDSALTYLGYAKYSLQDDIVHKCEEFLELKYLDLLFLELLFEYKARVNIETRLSDIKNFIDINRENIPEKFQIGARDLIMRYQTTIN